jgi:hypothetical protein
MGLIQSNVGGVAGPSSLANNGTFTTSSVGFNSATIAGNLLVMVLYGDASRQNGFVPFSSPVISGGYSASWGPTASAPYGYHQAFNYPPSSPMNGWAGIYFILNAPSMAPSQTTSITVQNLAGVTCTVQAEFDLYEFDALSTATVDTYGIRSAFTPTVGAILIPDSTTTDLIIMVCAGNGTAPPVGSGFTLGITSSISLGTSFGECQYSLSVAPPQSMVLFGTGGTQSSYGCVAIAFSGGEVGLCGVAKPTGNPYFGEMF